ncbi:MAG: TIGR02757 family protein [Geobacteraceae bacterium]|nr:TIGR02757 family protein [Geobacteraceae bacterium]
MKGEILKSTLDALYESRSKVHLANDPLSFCHRYDEPQDQEIAGLIASSFAYGNVKIILRNLEFIFSRIGSSPRAFAENFEPHKGLKLFAGFKHRFNDAADLCALLHAIRLMIADSGSIENFFRKGISAESANNSKAMEAFAAAILGFDYTPVFGSRTPPKDSYFAFLFPSPASGSACKRLCMYLRWMVRPSDGIDLGIWKSVNPSQLIIPVDAHIQRICTLLGFTSRKQADWKMACEITAALKKLSPGDPVKYDFSICHIGISEGCSGTYAEMCRQCPISGICRIGSK